MTLSFRLASLLALLAAGCSSPPPVPEGPAPVEIRPLLRFPGPLAAAPDSFFTKGEVTLRYRDIGMGEPLILLHGYTRSLNDWFGFADSLGSEARIIALDLRGFGESTAFGDSSRYGSRMADDVVALMDHLGLARAHLVGHSMGALIAANLASRHSSRVASAALIAGPFFADRTAFRQGTVRWVEELEAGRGLVAFLQWLFPGMDSALAQAMSSMALQENELSTLIAVMQSMDGLVVTRAPDLPVLIAVGTGDPLAPLSRDLVARWPKARLLEVSGANHVDILMRPEVLSAIRDLQRTRAKAGAPAG